MFKFLDYCSFMYDQGNPIISDEEFDYLAAKYSYEKVGVFYSKNAVPHLFKLYSLEKYYDNPPSFEEALIETTKLDGAAVALTYYDGKLIRILRRGNGVEGPDISHLLDVFDAPYKIPSKKLIQITGEVVAPKRISNARNYAAGSLNLKSKKEFAEREVYFIAYGIYPFLNNTYIDDMFKLKTYGFKTIIDSHYEEFPNDGVVYRVNNNQVFEDYGYTDHHPKGTFAFKSQKQGVITTIKDVIWQVGKGGAITPVAILNPIEIDDATISKASLHNMKFIRDKELEIGCQVKVIRSGDIIPYIVERV